jgi:hypothetical protein
MTCPACGQEARQDQSERWQPMSAILPVPAYVLARVGRPFFHRGRCGDRLRDYRAPLGCVDRRLASLEEVANVA